MIDANVASVNPVGEPYVTMLGKTGSAIVPVAAIGVSPMALGVATFEADGERDCPQESGRRDAGQGARDARAPRNQLHRWLEDMRHSAPGDPAILPSPPLTPTRGPANLIV